MAENAIMVRSVSEEINVLRSSLDSLDQLVGLEHSYIQRMQERDRLYRLVLESTRDWIICFDQQGLVADANQSVAQALACSEFDLVGRRVHELRLQRRVADSWELCRRAAMKPDALIQHEVQGVFPDGNTYALQTFFRPIDDGRGNITGIIMVGRDATGGSPSIQLTSQPGTNRMVKLLDALPQAVILIDQDHRIQYMNQSSQSAIGDHTGYACYQLLGQAEPCAQCPLEAVFAGRVPNLEYRLSSYGRELKGQARTHQEPDGADSVLLTLDDVTGTAEAERRTEYYQLLSSRQRDILVVADPDGNILEVNVAATQVYGYSADELLRMKLNDLGDMAGVMGVPADEIFSTGTVFETIHSNRAGCVFPVEVSTQWAVVEGHTVTINLVKDITAQKSILQEVRYASVHDSLTGLYNRAYLEHIEDWLPQENNYPLSLIMGDVNGLKLANDAFGYAAGDELIKAVAQAIQANCLRASDIAIRWGGDEFVIILPATDAHQASRICERVRETAASISHVAVAPSVAWGIATAPTPILSLSVLMKQAEERMQRSKLLDSHKTRIEIVASLHQRLQRQAYETMEHTDRVQHLAIGLGRLLDLPEGDLQRLTQLALLHDLGKVAIPEAVLQKPEHLTTEEWLMMQRHPEIGCRIASSIPELMAISDEILGHHERWDGTGYPRRLRGDEIPLLARIISIADAYAVMTAGRPYRPALSHPAAAGELVRCAGTQFDPHLVRLFVNQHGLAEAAAAGHNS